jgi:hypothetical protein
MYWSAMTEVNQLSKQYIKPGIVSLSSLSSINDKIEKLDGLEQSDEHSLQWPMKSTPQLQGLSQIL